MINLFRFVTIITVLVVAVLASLAVGGVLTSEQLWSNVSKIAQLAGIVLVAFGAVLLISNKK